MKIIPQLIVVIERLTFLLLVITVLSYFGSYYYIFEIFSHFKLQYLFLFLLSIGFFSLFDRKKKLGKWLLLSLFGFSLNIFAIAPLYFPAGISNQINSNQQFSLLLSNVLTSNQSKQKFVKLIQKQQADFIVALEVDTLWVEALKEIHPDYPYQKIIPREDNFGIAFYSKHPLNNISILDFAKNGIPSITAIAGIRGKKVQIIATHPLPPFQKSFTEQQKHHFKALAEYINNSREAIVVAGDLNTALWSSAYNDLIKSSSLKNTRQGFGIIPSWLVNSILRLPLDHILVSQTVHTLNIQAMGSIDSDHLPIYVELSFINPRSKDSIKNN